MTNPNTTEASDPQVATSGHLNKIHEGDCVAGLARLPDASVHLAFADPPFNIGYKYDVYDDKKQKEEYLRWCAEWMTELHRVLVPEGSYWLAIGDEYAAELKIVAEQAGFHLRNWVIWYYTFGVHCRQKFTRSHAHLFYFVKNPKKFYFDAQEIAVPSARQLVYADRRANPKGRTPDDTWILRPQDCRDAFNVNDDLWYFPRVNGTFKERAGFHGCQMPEQLLARIIRACSKPDEVVVDPFSGSGTTLVVAKKLHRQFIGFELSPEYATRGTDRLEDTLPGDRLEGAEDPKASVLSTDEMNQKRSGLQKRKSNVSFNEGFLPGFLDSKEAHDQSEQILDAFLSISKLGEVERVLLDPILNEQFQLRCTELRVTSPPQERNRTLLALRNRGKIIRYAEAEEKPVLCNWEDIDPFLYAVDIAWNRLGVSHPDLTLEEIFCIPQLAAQYDNLCQGIAPKFSAYDFRAGSIRMRSEMVREFNRQSEQRKKSKHSIEPSDLKDGLHCCRLSALDLEQIPSTSGIYFLRSPEGKDYYIGTTLQLDRRFQHQFAPNSLAPLEPWLGPISKLEVHWKEVSIDPQRPLTIHLSILDRTLTTLNCVIHFGDSPE